MMRAALAVLALSGCLSVPAPPDSRTHRWRELPGADQPGKLHSPRMAWDATRQKVVLQGGVDAAGTTVGTTWELNDDGTWSEICGPSSALPPLYSPAFAYDPAGQQLVLAGGSSTPNYMSPVTTVFTCSSTRLLASWEQHQVALPMAVVGAQLVHDGSRLILVGGNDTANMYVRQLFATTDLMSWTPLTAPAPATFGGAATNITYDAVNQRILALKNYTVEFGRNPEPTSELWQFPTNSDHWSLICGPSAHDCGWKPRFEAALAHLDASDSTFSIGGTGAGSPPTEFAGSWILDNEELVHSHDDPPARDRAGVAYDRDRERLVVYGGNGSGCAGNCGTTWVLEIE